jgi:hypothetical protein
MKNSKYMSLIPQFIPRGCYREIRKYQMCAEKENPEACLNDKISIMEVCPEHVLEGLREKKKHYLRAEVIDNETYKRAMIPGDYNRGRSVSDLTLKTWAHGKTLRTESTWEDDRYNPTKYSHPHRYDNVNFPDQEYSDFFGGTKGTALAEEHAQHKLGLFDGRSKAMNDHDKKRRQEKLRAAVEAVDGLNEKSA